MEVAPAKIHQGSWGLSIDAFLERTLATQFEQNARRPT